MVPNSVDVLVRDGGGGWLLHKGFGCCVWPSLETCMYTLFQTKICDFPFLISEVSAKSIPHFRTLKLVLSSLIYMNAATKKWLPVELTFNLPNAIKKNPRKDQDLSKTIPFAVAHA